MKEYIKLAEASFVVHADRLLPTTLSTEDFIKKVYTLGFLEGIATYMEMMEK